MQIRILFLYPLYDSVVKSVFIHNSKVYSKVQIRASDTGNKVVQHENHSMPLMYFQTFQSDRSACLHLQFFSNHKSQLDDHIWSPITTRSFIQKQLM